MKFFCTSGFVLLASMGWAAHTASAQGGDYAPSLLPLPSAAPIAATVAPTTYYTDPGDYSVNPNIGDASGSSRAKTPSQFTADTAPEPTPATDLNEALHAPCCDECSTCNNACGGRFFGAAAGLVMGRNRANPYWTTYQTNNNPNQLMNTQNAGADWSGGGQITVGYAFCGCGGPAVAFTYWGLAPMNGFASVTDQTGNINTALSTPMDLGGVTMNNGNPASDYFDNAHEQRIWRTDRFNNFELNAYTGLYNVGRLQFAGLAGLRYFRFSENLTYGSVQFGHNFGDNGGADEAYLGSTCINNLFGAQIGCVLNYNVTNRVSVFLIPKVGLYGNQMNCQTLLYTGDAANNPTYNILAHKSDVSMLSELDAGFSWAFRSNWRAFLGYRVIGVNNVALGDNQFLPFLADTQGFGQVKQDGSLILHGAFSGIAWAF
ncbi:MAG TPA: hypothetical protein VHV08_04685 [Pirellulales bacterium]|jgi:hypothetical protein|nr:hypothetical protein [Pirellulales bacterium]